MRSPAQNPGASGSVFMSATRCALQRHDRSAQRRHRLDLRARRGARDERRGTGGVVGLEVDREEARGLGRCGGVRSRSTGWCRSPPARRTARSRGPAPPPAGRSARRGDGGWPARGAAAAAARVGSRASGSRSRRPISHSRRISAVVAPTKPSASTLSDAVSTASATSARQSSSATITRQRWQAVRRSSGDASRSSVAAGTWRARASAGSANSSATSRPSAAAVASGSG